MSLHFDIAVDTDTVGIRAKIKADISHAMPILAQQILMDCNYFCKQDQGMLIDSSIMMTDFEAGDLIWDTVYANRQYWLPAACTDVNANAAFMWCHKAYETYHDDWESLLQKLIGGDGSD